MTASFELSTVYPASAKSGAKWCPTEPSRKRYNEPLPEQRASVTAVADEHKGERLVAFVAGHNATPREIWQS
jgi:hypothetical protein